MSADASAARKVQDAIMRDLDGWLAAAAWRAFVTATQTRSWQRHGVPDAAQTRGSAQPSSLRTLCSAAMKRFDLVMGVVERQRRAAGRRHAEELHQRMRAMVAGADRDAFQVEQGGQVVRMRAFDQEADHRRLVRRGAEDAQAVDLAQLLGEVRQQFCFARLDVGHAERVEVVDRRAEADEAGDVRRAGFELVRRRR